MGAVVAVFHPEEHSRRERRRSVERLAHEVGLKIRELKREVMVVLCAGNRLAFPYPGTANCDRIAAMKGALVVGTYDTQSDPDHIAADLEAALSEYYEGRVPLPVHVPVGNSRAR